MTSVLSQRDRAVILTSLATVTVLAWWYLIGMAREMHMPMGRGMAVAQLHSWTIRYFIMMLTMWIIMMGGMMVPSVTPVVLIYAAVARKAAGEGQPVASWNGFVAGYFVVWIAFSVLATIAQWQLDRLVLLSPVLAVSSPAFGAVLLILAGIYQWLPIKDQCLRHCRGPIQFLVDHWRHGAWGAFRMGLEHGIFCLGCCWALMLMLFVGGVMNLLWIALITMFVLAEKLMPFGIAGGRLVGLLMMVAGVLLAALRS